MHCALPSQTELSDTPNIKRTKTESLDEPRTIALKLSSNDYTSVNQIEVVFPMSSVTVGRPPHGDKKFAGTTSN